MRLNLKILSMFLLVALLTGCIGAESETEQMDVDTILTAAVGTMAASFFETQTAMVPPNTATPEVTLTPFPTPTPYQLDTPPASPTFVFFTALPVTPTFGTPLLTGTFSTATVNPASLASGCNNLAFVRDVTMPSGTVLQRNQPFTKTWKVQNTGTCNWLYQYRLVLLSGDPGGGESDYIRKQVAVWSWSEVSVFGTAPNRPGTYTSYWRMADGAGRMFGATLTMSFVVAQPTSAPPTHTPEPTQAPTQETPTEGSEPES
jgi:hypothetical protein